MLRINNQTEVIGIVSAGIRCAGKYLFINLFDKRYSARKSAMLSH